MCDMEDNSSNTGPISVKGVSQSESIYCPATNHKSEHMDYMESNPSSLLVKEESQPENTSLSTKCHRNDTVYDRVHNPYSSNTISVKEGRQPENTSFSDSREVCNVMQYHVVDTESSIMKTISVKDEEQTQCIGSIVPVVKQEGDLNSDCLNDDQSCYDAKTAKLDPHRYSNEHMSDKNKPVFEHEADYVSFSDSSSEETQINVPTHTYWKVTEENANDCQLNYSSQNANVKVFDQSNVQGVSASGIKHPTGNGTNKHISLTKHMESHANEIPIVCKECGKGFNDSGHLRKHMECHKKKIRFEYIDEGYNHSSHLKTHMLTHTNEKLHVCKHCGKGFPYSSHLKRHMLTHTNERPHVCKECGKGFNSSSNLKTHISTHTNERSYICVDCGKGFKCSGNLKKHILFHKNERNYVCKDCGKGFHQSSNLKTHMLTHTNERPYVCKDCGKGFNHNCSLKRHMKIHAN